MSEFLIKLSNNEVEIDGDIVIQGELEINGDVEKFKASASYWDRNKYLTQWIDSFRRLIKGENKALIITSMYDPKSANFIHAWVLYLIGDNVYIQNHIIFMDELEQDFDENDMKKIIPERETRNEDGEQISEWVVSLECIKKVIDKIR